VSDILLRTLSKKFTGQGKKKPTTITTTTINGQNKLKDQNPSHDLAQMLKKIRDQQPQQLPKEE
jgi:hypothetical protein